MSIDSVTIFRRVIDPDDGSLAPELARYLVALDFNREDHARHEALSLKAQEGTLTSAGREELRNFLHVDSLIAVMRLKAERSLARLPRGNGRAEGRLGGKGS